MLCLPVVAELRDCLVLPLGDEDRVEAEAGRAAGRCGDTALQGSGPPQRRSVGAERYELADVAGAPGVALHPVELAQHPNDLDAPRAARGMYAGPAAQAGDLDARVLAQRPVLRIHVSPAELRLRVRVLVVRGSRLGRVFVHRERLDLPAREQARQLARFVGVARGECCSQSVQRTSATFGTSATRPTSIGAPTPRGSARSNSRRRRSPSWLTTIDSMRAPVRSSSSITSPGGCPAGSSTSSRPSSGRNRRRMRYAMIRSG